MPHHSCRVSVEDNGPGIAPQILNSVPYVVTIIVVAGLVGRARAPAADGKPYIKE